MPWSGEPTPITNVLGIAIIAALALLVILRLTFGELHIDAGVK
jgi:hypothetical protein